MRISILPDQLNWALGHVANALVKHLPDIDFDVRKLHRRVRSRYSSKFDIVFVMYPPYLWEFNSYSSRFFGAVHSFSEIFVSNTLKDRISPTVKNSLARFQKLSVPCVMMKDFLYGEGISSVYTPYGVDPELFYPKKKTRNKKLTFGFVGDPDRHGGVKGYHDFIKPVLESNTDIDFKVALGGQYSHQEMVNFYNSIDILICMSSSETGPLPVLESMACGVPVISTPVGMVPQVVSHLEDGIITQRENLHLWIDYLRKNRDHLDLMGQCSLNTSRKWTWSNVISHWRSFFV